MSDGKCGLCPFLLIENACLDMNAEEVSTIYGYCLLKRMGQECVTEQVEDLYEFFKVGRGDFYDIFSLSRSDEAFEEGATFYHCFVAERDPFERLILKREAIKIAENYPVGSRLDSLPAQIIRAKEIVQ